MKSCAKIHIFNFYEKPVFSMLNENYAKIRIFWESLGTGLLGHAKFVKFGEIPNS